ncbi:MAG TPA: DNA mismatch repair endonuclease MutL [Candidatus Methylacidiphilales bacterium]|jgi:DNA mismatch repair protein MutL|nr:DNA mismatch repair endonuclease MutL [Candidatus Methylacidiphilales bacterium]
MNRIHLLPEHVANQIAAGEVIERPASVLKELLENSLDAGATQVDVQIGAGGRSLVAVTDNGCGMSRDDALLCLERHATSKLRDSDDLDRIASYGFRGEAIPSIASVSKFRLRTREAEAIAGTEIVIDGGKLRDVHEIGLAPGTQIEVRSLFYNLPARRKFLRTEATESAHIRHTLLLAGLARPDAGFTLTMDEQPAQRWMPGEDLRQRLVSIFGAEWAELTAPIEAASGGLRLRGFIGKPGVSRAARTEELFFINQRPVENRTLHFGLLEGYHNSLMKGRYPVAILFLEMDPSGVDVNIHPAKREVRFHDDFTIRHFVVQSVREALEKFSGAPAARITFEGATSVTATATETPNGTYRTDTTHRTDTVDKSHPSHGSYKSQPPTQTPPLQLASEAEPLASQPTLPLPEETPAPRAAPRPEPVVTNRLGLHVIGCVGQLYLVAESAEGLVLIDQHAAHERVLFEQMLKRMALQDPASQQLLFPVTLEFLPREADFLLAQVETLQQAGVGITRFGPSSFLVDALPAMVKARDVAEFIRTVVTDLQQEGGETRKGRRLSEDIVAKTVCRHAVKANDALKPAEWDMLLHDLLACDLPYTCPHGRPTMIQLSLAELDKKFGRTP